MPSPRDRGELTKTETIDVMDAAGVEHPRRTKGREVMRILPRNHDGVNEKWLSDKSRYVWDGLRRQSGSTPLHPREWQAAARHLARGAGPCRRQDEGGVRSWPALSGDLVPVEAAFALNQLVEGQGGSVECRTDGANLPGGNRAAYAGTATIEEIDTA